MLKKVGEREIVEGVGGGGRRREAGQRGKKVLVEEQRETGKICRAAE